MSKAKIKDEILKELSIPILDNGKLIIDLKDEPLVISAFGKFYKSIYDDKEVTLKIVDITLNENIINELILWKKYLNSANNFLKLKGVILKFNLIYIIFEDCFKYTLESMLLSQKKKLLNEKVKINIAKQILEILNIIQKDNEINSDLRPGTLAITSDKKVKLIDFGLMLKIPDFPNKEIIQNNNMKYSPPEYLLQKTINNSYDIYSFGCILIDLFSNDMNNTILTKTYEKYDDYINEIKENKYPKIPENLNFLLEEIIKKCIDKDPNQRIKMNELYYNLNILFDNIKQKFDENNVNEINFDLNNNEIIENEKYIKLKNLFKFSDEINSESIKYEKKENEIKLKTEKMKINLDNGYRASLIELNKLQEKLKLKIDEVINQNKEIIKSFYDKTLENIIYFLDLLSNSMTDIFDIKKTAPEIQILLKSYNNFINKNKYENVENVFQSWKNDVEKKVKKYTNNKYYDIIDLSFDKCSKFVNKNEELTNNYFNEINKLYENIKNMKGFFGEDNQIENELNDQILIQKLINDISSGIDLEEMKKEHEKNIESMTNNIYAKIVENSNMISIFNYHKKEIKNYIIFPENEQKTNNFRFNSNCFSLYNPDKNYIYISGGIKDIKDQNSHDNSFYRLDISINKNFKNNNNLSIYNNYKNIIGKSVNYRFKLNKLNSMNNPRSCHSMLNLSSNKNIILSISGINTDSCEVYNIDYDNWQTIKELPMKCENPGIIDYNNYIFVFPYTKDYNNIYKMNLKNNIFEWESIKYSINEGNIKKGMVAIPNENILYLLGGYDNEGNYSHIFEINDLDDENKDIEIKLSSNLSLPNEIYFNSNYIKYYINKENEEDEEEIALIMDNYNGVLEFDINSGKFEYYLGK